jgi:hypothetical protein
MINRIKLLNSVSALALLAEVSFSTQPAAALTITFDDLADTSAGFGGTPIANGYQGLNWTNWNTLNTADFTANFGPNGAQPGTVSQTNVAYNPTGGEAIFSAASPFTLNSFYLTAVWQDDLPVTVTGLLGGIVEDTETVTPLATGPTLETFNWADISEVEILPGIGTNHSGYSGSGTQVSIDNLTLTPTITTPEPSTLAILGAGLAGLSVVRRRRREAV